MEYPTASGRHGRIKAGIAELNQGQNHTGNRPFMFKYTSKELYVVIRADAIARAIAVPQGLAY